MSDSQPAYGPAPSPPRDGQARVATTIVAGLVVVALGLIVAAVVMVERNDTMIAGAAFTTVGTIVGGLCVALNTPSGVSNALRALKDPGAPPP